MMKTVLPLFLAVALVGCGDDNTRIERRLDDISKELRVIRCIADRQEKERLKLNDYSYRYTCKDIYQ